MESRSGKLWKALNRGLDICVIGLMAFLVIDVVWQVCSRYLLSNPSSWTEELATFLHLFRKMRTDSRSNGKTRWLTGGSVNIRGTLDELDLLKTINDLKVETLPRITEPEAAGFISMMLTDRNVRYDDSLIPRMCELLGDPIPYFLQLFTQELYRYWRREKPATLTGRDADTVFRRALLGEAAHDKLQHYHSRIRIYYPDDEQEHPSRRLLQVSPWVSPVALDFFIGTDEGVEDVGDQNVVDPGIQSEVADVHRPELGRGRFDLLVRLCGID